MKNNEKDLILAVDDTEQNLSILGNILTENGFNVSMATSGKEALELLQELTPDLILLDIMMPKLDGYELCKILKEDQKMKDIPIIFLTAKTETDDLVKGFNFGAVDYVVKPFNKEELLARIKTHTKLKRTENELLELIRVKDRLFSIIGHDLRSHIGNFLMVMEFVANPNYSSTKKEEYLQMMQDIAKNSYTLLENLLNWARSQQKMVLYKPAKMNIKDLVNLSLSFIDSSIKNKSISIESQIENGLSASFDKDTILTVLRNLITNAVKFTKENGKIIISAKKSGNYIQVSTKDNGVGISNKDMNKLFKPDLIHSTKGTKDERGTGLGLLLCKDFVEGNGGTIWVESKIGKGTTFHFTLPVGN